MKPLKKLDSFLESIDEPKEQLQEGFLDKLKSFFQGEPKLVYVVYTENEKGLPNRPPIAIYFEKDKAEQSAASYEGEDDPMIKELDMRTDSVNDFVRGKY